MEKQELNTASLMAEVKALATAYKPLMAMMNEMNKKNDEVVAETEGSEAVSGENANNSNNEADVAVTRGIKAPTTNTPPTADDIEKYEATWKRIIENYKKLKPSKK